MTPKTHPTARSISPLALTLILMLALVLGLLLTGGCAGRPSILPNPDPALRKSSAELAAAAAKRFPYPTDVHRGGEAEARAQVGYTMNRLEVVNLSDEPWEDVEIWVNETYVVPLPLMQPGVLKILPFSGMFNENGQAFPTNNLKTRVNKVEVLVNGTMYDVPLQLAD